MSAVHALDSLSFVVQHVFDLWGQPLHTFMETFPGDSVTGTNVPRLVHDPLQAQSLWNLENKIQNSMVISCEIGNC